MKIKEFIGSTVLDKNANEVGRIDNVDFDKETGKIEAVTLTLQKNIFSRDELEISFEDIATIGAYVILNPKASIITTTIDSTIIIAHSGNLNFWFIFIFSYKNCRKVSLLCGFSCGINRINHRSDRNRTCAILVPNNKVRLFPAVSGGF